MRDIKWIGKAMVLGLSFFIAVLIIKPVGVSTQFNVLSGVIHSTLDKNVIFENHERESGYESTNAYYDRSDGKLAKSIKHPINYSFIFVLAIPLGAYIARRVTKKEEDHQQTTSCGIDQGNLKDKGFVREYLPPFISGFLLLFGARMAGGCTSGHMMSGIMQSSISGFIFAVAVFIVAIPVAIQSSKKGV